MQTWFIIGGVVTGLMGIASLFIPAIMHFEDGRTATLPIMAEKPVISELELVGERLVKAAKSNPAEVDYT